MKPEDIVISYIQHWCDAWREAKQRMAELPDFDMWRSLISPVDAAHFVAGRDSGSAGSFGSTPGHDPSIERVTNVAVDGGRAVVETTADQRGTATYREYDLARASGSWRIERITVFFVPADKAVVDEEKRAAALAAARADAPFDPLPAAERPDGDLLFLHGRTVIQDGHETITAVERAGHLDLPSGILVVRDFGYEVYDFPVIRRRVPPGRYPVELVFAFDRVAAVRVRLSKQRVASWHPATDAAGGHVIAVDAANVAICDAAAFAAMPARRRERLFVRAVDDPDGMKPATFMTLARGTDGVLVESGWGDGGYPAYFGVDSRGEPAVFMVDFLIL